MVLTLILWCGPDSWIWSLLLQCGLTEFSPECPRCSVRSLHPGCTRAPKFPSKSPTSFNSQPCNSISLLDFVESCSAMSQPSLSQAHKVNSHTDFYSFLFSSTLPWNFQVLLQSGISAFWSQQDCHSAWAPIFYIVSGKCSPAKSLRGSPCIFLFFSGITILHCLLFRA